LNLQDKASHNNIRKESKSSPTIHKKVDPPDFIGEEAEPNDVKEERKSEEPNISST